MKEDVVARMRNELTEKTLPLLFGTNNSIKWQHYDGKDLSKGMIYKSQSSQGTMWKIEATIDNTLASSLYKLITSVDDSWVPYVDESTLHQQGSDWSIVQQTAKGMMSISNREMVLLRTCGKKVEDSSKMDAFYQVWSSIDQLDDLYPNVHANSVRGKAHPSGLLLKQIGANKCHFTYVHCVDLKGSFPNWILDMAANTFLQSFLKALKSQATKIGQTINK